MPTYAYRCRKCGHEFEEFHGIKDVKPRKCPKCKSRADRVPAGGSGLLFKGSGFYITDYRSKGYQDKAKAEKSGGSKSESGGKSGGEGGGKSGGESKKSGDGGKKSGGD
jgi:putative FmdB family regulatory protein